MRDAEGLTADGRVDGRPATIRVLADALEIDGALLEWTAVDALQRDVHQLVLTTSDGASVTVHHLGRRFDRVADAATAARDRARRRALLQHADAEPLLTVRCRLAGTPASLCLFADRVTVEPVSGAAVIAPFGVLSRVDRDGWTVTLGRRGLDPVVVSHMGAHTDELLNRLAGTRDAARARARAARVTLDPALGDLELPDGWAVAPSEAGAGWPALRSAVRRMARAEELEVLEALPGCEMRLGIKAVPGGVLPFALASVGGRTAVEAVDADDRATLVFASDDVERLNAVLLLTSFRREALTLPEDRLGRWSLAVRLLPEVREARAALVARVVHDDRWASGIGAVLGQG